MIIRQEWYRTGANKAEYREDKISLMDFAVEMQSLGERGFTPFEDHKRIVVNTGFRRIEFREVEDES